MRPLHPYSYDPHLSADKVSSREPATKQATPRLLDGLARYTLQPARKRGYIKIATISRDIADARTPWMVNVLVSSTDIDCYSEVTKRWFEVSK